MPLVSLVGVDCREETKHGETVVEEAEHEDTVETL